MNEKQKEMAAMGKTHFNVPLVQRARFHSIHIDPADNNGFIVRIGCKNFVVNDDSASISDMCNCIKEYLNYPFEVERKFMKRQYDVFCEYDRLTGNVVAEESCTVPPPTQGTCVCGSDSH